jgi:hypothetical protein
LEAGYMAIFAKKKDGRGGAQRNRQDETDADTSTEKVRDSVALDVPDSWQQRPAATAAKAATYEGNTVTEQSKAEGAEAAARVDGAAVAPAETATSPDGAGTSAAPAPVAAERAPGGDGDAIEPVDIEPEEVVAPARSFGIAEAIRLMRSLPADPNIELVVRVVRVTLGAVNVSVEDIMQDAERKEKRVRESIASLENDVADLEKQLQDKRAAISAHQADLRETATVRERLNMADKYTPHPPPLPPDAARISLPKPREWERFDSDTPFKDS